jgi:lipoprotein-anchoring transpeptidase ErfK/SrfK
MGRHGIDRVDTAGERILAITRRTMLGGCALMGLGGPRAAQAAFDPAPFFSGKAKDHGFTYNRSNVSALDPVWHRQLVEHEHREPPGTIIVDTQNHFLYVTFENNTALRYGVGVGLEGFKWFGRATVDRKAIWPGWTPPPEMLARRPDLPRHMAGGPDNPLGPRALYLYRNGTDLGYRLHGTLEPWTIGTDASSGCVRLLPEDIMDLYQRAPVGTAVLVLEHIH